MDLDLSKIEEGYLRRLGDERFKQLLGQALTLSEQDRKENQLVYYKPVSKYARRFHFSEARVICLGGGNGSSKTDTALAEIAMCCTGIRPESLSNVSLKKFRGPINVRVVCESLTTTLHPIILPKLQWWKWNGIDAPGGVRGHWGWIPKSSLIDGSWDRSWSEKTRMLRIKYQDPATGRVTGESTIQFMSVDQDASDFASGDFHIVLHDEPPTYAIWRENEARTMRVRGRMMLAMTWPDDPSINVDWIYDEVYECAQDGPNRDLKIEWINLYTFDNPNLDQTAVAEQSKKWTDEVRSVRIYGQPIRFSNRIHPLFTDIHKFWCFDCMKEIIPVDNKCTGCGGDNYNEYNHVDDILVNKSWPCIFALDPHPRKPHMWLWIQVNPYDDLVVVAEDELAEDPVSVKQRVDLTESSLGLVVAHRLMDPNMGASPSSSNRRLTWQDEFQAAGLYCDLADDSDVGRGRINEYLVPDLNTRSPRLHVRPSCRNTIHQFKRYMWDDFKKGLDKDIKQKPKDKNSDYPTLLKYVLNYDPTFEALVRGHMVIHTRGNKRNSTLNYRKFVNERLARMGR